MYLWSQTPAANANADPNINYREGQAPSSVNDSARSLMSRAAMFRDDITGSIETGGTSSAYTLTSNQNFNPLGSGTLPDNITFAFRPHVTNADSATMNVDSTGALPIRVATGQPIPAGYLIEGTPYRAMKIGSEILIFGAFGNAYGVPIGGVLDYVGDTAPNSNFALPRGQAISRADFPDLFTLIGTRFGAGNGSTTFNILDFRGRVAVALDNLGGSAAGIVTGATSVGVAAGAQSQTLPRAALPNVALSGSGITNTTGAHAHTYNTWNGPISSNGIPGGNANSFQTNATSTAGDHAHTVSIATESINGGVTQQPISNMQPYMAVTKLLRVR